MGHLVGKDIYRRLGKKVDNLTMRAPWNETLHAILKELYLPEEADLVVAMPYGMSSLERLKRVTRMEERRLLPLLEGMCDKGLVIDLLADGKTHHAPSGGARRGVHGGARFRADRGVDRPGRAVCGGELQLPPRDAPPRSSPLPGAAGVLHLLRARGAIPAAAQPGEGDLPGGDAGAVQPLPRPGARLQCG